MKCICGVDLKPNDNFCGRCGSRVTIDENKLKKCPNCEKLLTKEVQFCTSCGFKFDDVSYCKGRKEDGSICNVVVSGSFCSVCGTENKRDSTCDALDGASGDCRPSALVTGNSGVETEIKSQNEVPVESKPVKKLPKGLAVICVHGKFVSAQALNERQNAYEDAYMMEQAWKDYGCDTLVFKDKTNTFYEKTLISEIEKKLEKMNDLEFFVFVLSTHGQEVVEGESGQREKQNQHYFYTKDNQYNTQLLMDRIASIQNLNNTLKMFVIQACRSGAALTRSQGEDLGFELIVNKTKVASTNIEDGININDGLVKEISSFKSNYNDGIDVSDAKGYMPPPGADDRLPPAPQSIDITSSSTNKITYHDEHLHTIIETVSTERNVHMQQVDDYLVGKETTHSQVKVEAQVSLEGAISDASKEQVKEMPPIQAVPHCDDSIVIFASMSGKFAYSKMFSPENTGGWLIKALDTILSKYKPHEEIHITDLLTEVNREVGSRQLEIKQNILGLEELEKRKENENADLHNLLSQHITNLREVTDKNIMKTEIQECRLKIDSLARSLVLNADNSVALQGIREELDKLTKTVVKHCDLVVLKAQSCFFHNLAFDYDKLYLVKRNRVSTS